MASVRFENISFRYDDNYILKDFSLEIDDGQIMSLVGPSGCGKTTLVRCLLGLNTPETGEIYVGDRCVFSKEKRINVPPEKRHIGIVFQDYAVWPHLTVSENVIYPLKRKRVKKEEAKRRVERALEQVDMSMYANHLPGQLSGGQQQRVAIARALLGSDDLIVMDEPITNLDAKLREQMLFEIREIQRNIGTTIFYITHDQQAALLLSDELAIMEQDGSIVQIGDAEQIVRQPINRFTFEFIGVSNFIPLIKKENQYYVDLGDKEVQWTEEIPEDLRGEDEIEIGIRPNDIIFDDSSPVRGIVKHCIFLGSEYEYFVMLGDLEIRIQQNALDASRVGVFEEGREVGLNLANPRYYKKKEEDLNGQV